MGDVPRAASTATAAGQTERASVATRRAAALEEKLIRLVVSVPPASDLAGLEISRDGVALPKAVWNTALPIDPGEHALEVSAPGKKSWSKKITADESNVSMTIEFLSSMWRPWSRPLPPPGLARRPGT